MATRVRLVQLDGGSLRVRGRSVPFPNLALMKLAHWHRAQGHEVHFSLYRDPQCEDFALYDPAIKRHRNAAARAALPTLFDVAA
jgi:hypothetical protein